MARKAFTLIELLVVIAIIAILAAILFPVFAQAKAAAKKTAYISNVKQAGTAVQIYLSDSDDNFPMTKGVRPDGTGTWGTGVAHPVPYNAILTAPWTQDQRLAMAQVFWANSIQPYMKNYQLLNLPVANTVDIFSDQFNPAVSPASVGMQMNGLFHTLNSSQVAAVSNAVLFWQVQKLNLKGRGFESPALNCPGAGPGALQANPIPCRFNPGGAPSTDASQGNSTMYVADFTTTTWLFDKRMVVGHADSSTKSVPVGTIIDPNVGAPSSSKTDPWASVSNTGAPESYWDCGPGGPDDQSSPGQYPCYFRPDRTW